MTFDPHWNNVVLAMHMDGSSGSTSFVDLAGHTVELVGAPSISTTQSQFGGASGYFDGSSYLKLPDTTTDVQLPGDFTIELWYYPINASSERAIFSLNNYATGAGVRLAILNSGFYCSVIGDAFNNASSGLSLNTWHHFAVTRSGNTISVYQNGVLKSSGVVTGTMPTFDRFAIGGADAPGYGGLPAYGYIDDVRITNGVVRYTAAFTPPTVAFPLGAAGRVSGVVTDSSNATAIKLVRLYRRDTGALVGETLSDSSGAFQIDSDSTNPHFVVCHDASNQPPTGGTLNALIFDSVTPVSL